MPPDRGCDYGGAEGARHPLVEIDPTDDSWINNSLAIAPGRLLMPEGATNRTLDALAQHGVTWSTIPYAAMHKNGGGIHCSTMPLIRDPI